MESMPPSGKENHIRSRRELSCRHETCILAYVWNYLRRIKCSSSRRSHRSVNYQEWYLQYPILWSKETSCRTFRHFRSCFPAGLPHNSSKEYSQLNEYGAWTDPGSLSSLAFIRPTKIDSGQAIDQHVEASQRRVYSHSGRYSLIIARGL